MDEGRTDDLVFFAFDLWFPNGESTPQLRILERKERLQRLFKRKKEIGSLRYSNHVTGDGPRSPSTHASWVSRASFQSAPIDYTRLVIVGSGSSPSTSTARSSLSSAGPAPRAVVHTLAPCCWATTLKMAGCTTPVGRAPA
jgi:hypothetical protein